jgi:hypothetical protein
MVEGFEIHVYVDKELYDDLLFVSDFDHLFRDQESPASDVL